MKPKKCQLILHGRSRQIDMGEFPSIAKAKAWIRDCWDRPYSIKPIKEKEVTNGC